MDKRVRGNVSDTRNFWHDITAQACALLCTVHMHRQSISVHVGKNIRCVCRSIHVCAFEVFVDSQSSANCEICASPPYRSIKPGHLPTSLLLFFIYFIFLSHLFCPLDLLPSAESQPGSMTEPSAVWSHSTLKTLKCYFFLCWHEFTHNKWLFSLKWPKWPPLFELMGTTNTQR